jgi:predicted branched-subunit amino acid permease
VSDVARSSTLRDAIGLGLAVGLYGIAFGAAADAAGLDVWQAMTLSLLMFTGASQFALVGVVGAGGAPLSGMAAGLLLGTRNTLYGLRLSTLLGFRGWRRTAASHLVIDESTAMSVSRESRAAARVGFLATGLAVFVLWNLATFVGALAGGALGDPKAWGFDSAVGGAFLALLWPRLKNRRNQLCAALAVALALVLVPVVPAGVPVLAAGVVALGLGLVGPSEDPTELPDQHDLAEGGLG